MTYRFSVRSVLAVLCAGIAFSFAGRARADDPPTIAGRLSYLEGTVSFHDDQQDQWFYAAMNYPVTSGQSFWTQPDGRAEIQIASDAVRMDNGTELDVLKLDNTTTQLQLDQGTISYTVKQIVPGTTIEIETPHGAVSLTQPGIYHIEAGDDTHPTTVATLQGEARFIGPHSYLDIGEGEQATAIGDPATYTMAEAATTPFDDWALQRDQAQQPVQSAQTTTSTTSTAADQVVPLAPQSATAQYVSPQITGYQDLNQYGSWQTVPQYGAIWIPASVPAEWAPYRVGHWAWVAPWGWTWIDNQPWGFAPFHYGRWAQINQQWAWVPGPIVPHPVYAPALVAFIGGVPAPGVHVGIGIGGLSIGASIGWLPLAPNEVYYPPYHPSLRYLQAVNYGPVNRVQVNRITNNYTTINRTVNNYANAPAATVVPQQAFVNARPIQQAAMSVTPQQLHQVPVTANLSAIKPTAISRAAALPAAFHPTGEPFTAPGPSPQQEHAEAQAIQHAEPKSLSTTGMQEAKPAAAGAGNGPVLEHTAPTPQPPAQHAAATQTAKPPAPAAPMAGNQLMEPSNAEAGTWAPGPVIKAAAARKLVPLRQKVLAASLAAKPRAATPAAAHPQTAKKVVQPVAFHPATVERPKQSAPLKPTPAGWHRQTADAKPAAKPEEAKPGEKKDERQK
jgi:hypothetical protein